MFLIFKALTKDLNQLQFQNYEGSCLQNLDFYLLKNQNYLIIVLMGQQSPEPNSSSLLRWTICSPVHLKSPHSLFSYTQPTVFIF